MTLVANARMYSVCARAADDWKQLLQWVLAHAKLDWQVIDYPAPAPLSVLWARDDLGLAMMCGLPYALSSPRPTLVAAPIPAAPRYGGKPVYFTDLVVRADSAWQSLEDSFGGVVGYTLADSMSGGLALRNHLAPYRRAHGSRLYRGAVGGLVHARGVIEALSAGHIDVGPLDSYYHELLQAYEPALAAQVRIVATTAAAPIPVLMATAALSEGQLANLRAALHAVSDSAEMAPVMERLLLAGFAVPEPADYDSFTAMAHGPLESFEEL